MRDPAERRRVLDLIAAGMLPAHVARELGIPQSTVAHWVDPKRAAVHERRLERQRYWRVESCPHCSPDTAPALDERAYAFLLGHYLGDGHITRQPSDTWALSIYCTDAWPGIMDEVADAEFAVLRRRSSRVKRKGCTAVKVLHPHLPCLFPQHGPGKKHERDIVLEPWQAQIVRQYPGLLLRGLFHSDGWRGENVAVHRKDGQVVRYRYPRYMFSNRSADIRRICADTLDLLKIPWRPNPPWQISVSRRAAVAALDEHVGPKY